MIPITASKPNKPMRFLLGIHRFGGWCSCSSTWEPETDPTDHTDPGLKKGMHNGHNHQEGGSEIAKTRNYVITH